jgi:hypothetical protein
MGQSTPVFDSAQQQGGSILQSCGACIEDAVDGIRPILAGQDRVGWMPQEQWRIVIAFDVRGVVSGRRARFFRLSGFAHFSAIRKDSVDSAP